jgi:predicted Zn-dependent protease
LLLKKLKLGKPDVINMTIKIENNHPVWMERIVNVRNLGTYVQKKTTVQKARSDSCNREEKTMSQENPEPQTQKQQNEDLLRLKSGALSVLSYPSMPSHV